MQHNLRDPSRDRTHGRIYRVTAEGRPLLKPARIAGEPVAKLLDLLKEPEDRVRYRARIELGGRNTKEVMAALGTWLAWLDRNDQDFEHHRLEGLWLHQSHNVVNADLLRQVLKSPDFHARAAATRVLCYWRDRVPDSLDLLKVLAADPYPRVRLEAVRAASFFTAPEALEVPLISAEHPADPYLDYTRGETLRALEPYWKKAVAEGRSIQFTSDAGARFFLRSVATDELLKMKRDRAIDREILTRKGVRDEDRNAALADLARIEDKSPLRVLLDTVQALDGEKKGRDEAVVLELAQMLTSRPAGELATARNDLESLATGASLPVTRQLGYLALIAAEGVDKVWQLANRSPDALTDLLQAMPLIRDPAQRAALYPKVLPLLDRLPAGLAADTARGGKGTYGRYVRIELPGRRKTLTLAEVEVISDGRNVGRRGKASQKNTANGGDAARALDGNTGGAYEDGGQTHTQENTANPWWEVDLGSEVPIDSVLIYNRTEGNLGRRLDGYTLKVLDGTRQTVFEKTGLPAPERRATVQVGGGNPEGVVRRAAMTALASVRGREAETFRALARFVRSGVDRQAAVQAIERIPASFWPKDEAQPLLDSLVGYVKSVPVQERTSPAVVDALHLGESLAGLLPRDESLRARRAMGELGVRVLRLGTLVDQMLFDKDKVAIRAAKPVEVVFENNDLMPHNFVVTAPGALEEVGTLAEAQATQPGALERGYIPRSEKVLVHSRLLQPRDSQTLRFTAPAKPGVYPYVCTYPGHWRRMYGALYVVEDLDEYLSDPESYLARNPLPILDDLLKSNRPRKEWTFDELASSVNPLAPGRSYSNGKQMFLAASCVTCHKLNGVGEPIGPDLAQLDPKMTPAEILKNILNPSEKIDEKFQTYLFETDSGRVVTGLVLEDKGDTIKVIENPLAKSEPVVLRKSEIAERVKSPNSVMPKGLLDKLTKEEVLDLVAYIAARGDAKNPVFEGGHEHNHNHGPGR
jgi:putative heme-binding domain-containing protein